MLSDVERALAGGCAFWSKYSSFAFLERCLEQCTARKYPPEVHVLAGWLAYMVSDVSHLSDLCGGARIGRRNSWLLVRLATERESQKASESQLEPARARAAKMQNE
jgi:hypothetical protein